MKECGCSQVCAGMHDVIAGVACTWCQHDMCYTPGGKDCSRSLSSSCCNRCLSGCVLCCIPLRAGCRYMHPLMRVGYCMQASLSFVQHLLLLGQAPTLLGHLCTRQVVFASPKIAVLLSCGTFSLATNTLGIEPGWCGVLSRAPLSAHHPQSKHIVNKSSPPVDTYCASTPDNARTIPP